MLSIDTFGLLGLLIGLAGIALSYITYRRTREDKRLDYEIIVNTRVLVPKHIDEGLELRYKGVEVKDPSLIIIRFINSGNRPISPSDQVEPLSVSFPEKDWPIYGRILSASLARASIPTDKVTIKIVGDRAEITPMLLNQGDWLAVRFLIDKEAEPQISGRVVGVPELRPLKFSRRLIDPDVDWITSITIPAIPVIGAWTIWTVYFSNDDSQVERMNMIFLAASTVALIAGLCYAKLRQRRWLTRDRETQIPL